MIRDRIQLVEYSYWRVKVLLDTTIIYFETKQNYTYCVYNLEATAVATKYSRTQLYRSFALANLERLDLGNSMVPFLDCGIDGLTEPGER